MTPELAEKVILVSLVVAAVGLLLAMPQRGDWLRAIAAFAASFALLAVVKALDDGDGSLTDQALFWLFAVGAIASGVLLITRQDPVHAALWFSVATLSTCGLFLQLSAPFLAAATVIVYAGAIIVTFLFVIMLAKQDGEASYDAAARFPLPAVCATCFTLGVLAMNLHHWAMHRAGEGGVQTVAMADTNDDAHPLSRIQPDEAKNDLHSLGRTLFGDHLFHVELAGTLLLLATVGAITMAPRRARGDL
jgi:NADH-quinone oxidoreductase subunit J